MKWHREWFIRVPWGKMALVSRGHPDGEPVLLVHGRQDSLSIFEPLIEQMSEQYYYVALDMPGNGLSDAFPHVTNKPLPKNELNYAVVFNKPPRAGRPFIEFNKYDQSLTYLHKTTSKGPKLQRFHFLYAMELTLLHLGWDKFIFMGHSMGCEQGLFYNVLYPGQITKMILLDAGPTLMRMQIEDNAEYQKLFYDSYYENYHRDNFMRKAHTRLSASQSLRRLRDLSEAQCEHLLERNFHAFGTENSGRPSNVIEASTSNQANLNQRPDHSLNEAQNEDVQDSVMYATRRAQNDPRAQNTSRNRNRRQNKDELTDTDEELTDTDKKLTDTDEELTDTDEENASRRANRRLNRSGRDDGMSGFIQRLHDNDEPGYLSWDNRLKNLAPQNYGNEYYFELFKTIPPTLLIAASDGAKNIPPIPKWRQGAKELLDKLSTLENYHRVDVEGSHDVHYTHPERVVPFINAFLKDNKVYSKL